MHERTKILPHAKVNRALITFMHLQAALMEWSNHWDLQAVVRSCVASEAAAVARRGIATVDGARPASPEFTGRPVVRPEAGGLDRHELPFSITPSGERPNDHHEHEAVFISFTAASTSGQQPRKKPGRKPAGRTTLRPKRSKEKIHQLKKVVCEVPVADGGVSTDLWAWRKYGQKPIKGSPYPRGYYKCSSLKACVARKMVERSPENPGVLVVTYVAEHCHAVPTMLSSLAGAGATRHRPVASPDRQSRQSHGASDDSADATSMTVNGGGAETPDGENDERRPVDSMALDDFLGILFGDDFDHFLDDDDDDSVLGR